MDVQTMTAQEAPRPRSGPGRIATLAVMGVTGALILAVAFLANEPAAGTADGSVTSVTLSGTATGEAPAVGRVAPDFAATTADGTTFRLSDLRGRPVWLTFGASWCQPCRAENPDIEATYEKYAARGVAVVQVYMSEGASAVTEYADRVGLTYTKIPDPDERLANEYRILGIPTHYFIDAQGVLRQLKIGSLDPAAMEAALEGIGG
jgi:peroxiredoxin